MTPQCQPGAGVRGDAGPPGRPRPPGRPGPPGLPRLADGAELAGEFVGAGYREPPLLVYRADGQVVRLPELLYRTIRALHDCHRFGDPAASRRSFTDRQQVLEAVAATLSQETGRQYAPGHIEFLLDKKLAPLGVTTFSDGSPPEVVKPQPILSLTCKATMLSEKATWFLAGLFTWLFRAPVLVVALAAILVAEAWMFIAAPLAAAMEQTIRSPGAILIVALLAIASTGFHEIGHGTACRYGGVRPGVTGCGFYLAWPVFYTDITNSYRLGRGGRLRTDFGGVYFNGIFILALTALYLATGAPVLLAGILSTSLEAVQQLLPTLRFDGYYIIADLVGIPDLFKYIGPILRRVLFRKPDDGRLAALKRWPQVIITIWVLLVVPVLFGQLGLLAYNFPSIFASDWNAIHALAAGAMNSGDPVLGVASATVQILFLLFPLVGMVLIGFRLLRGLIRLVVRRLRVARATRADDEVATAPMEGLLDGPEQERARAAEEVFPWPAEGGLPRPTEEILPGPRHSARYPGGRPGRRPGLAAFFGAAMALGVAVTAAWVLAPSMRQGPAADTQPDGIIGVPASQSPGGVSRQPGTGQRTRRFDAAGTGRDRSLDPASSTPSATWPSAASPTGRIPGSGDQTGGPGSPAAGAFPRGGSSSPGQSSPSRGSSRQGSPGEASPGEASPGQTAPGSPSAGGSSAQPSPLSPDASGSDGTSGSSQSSPSQGGLGGYLPSQPSAGQPAVGQPSAGQSSGSPGQQSPSQPSANSGQSPSQGSSASPSSSGSPAAPSSAAHWTPAPGQSPSGQSPSGQSPSGQSSSGQTPSGQAPGGQPSSGSPSQPSASSPHSPQSPAGSSPSATPGGCMGQVNLVLLELNGLCPQ